MSETKQAETRADGLKQFRQWRAENPNLVAYPDVCFCAGVLAGREHERRITAKEIAQKLRERIGDCAGAIISLRDIEEIEREYEVK